MTKLLDNRNATDVDSPTIARALYLKSLICYQSGDEVNGKVLEQESFRIRDDLLAKYDPDLLKNVHRNLFKNPLVIFDHCINVDQGRSTIGQFCRLVKNL